jgi:hypothetical protein
MRNIRPYRPTTSARLRGLIGGLSALGAVSVALIMALSPAASAVSAAGALHNASPIIGEATGIGKMDMSGQAKTCSAKLGGVNVESYSDVEAELGAFQAVKLTAAASTVNVTWNIHAIATTAATGKLGKCPTTNYSATGLFINSTGGSSYGYINESESFCEVEAFMEIFAETEIYDSSAGTYAYGFNLIADNESGSYYENYVETINYTNPAWTNSTYSCLNCSGTFGPASTNTYSGTYSSYTSGTWAKGDKLQITTYVYAFAEAYIEYASHAKTSASFDGATGPNHMDLTSIIVS